MRFLTAYTQCNTNRGTPPALCTFRGEIHCLYQQTGNNDLTHVRSPNGLYWDQPHQAVVPNTKTGGKIATSAGPCCVVYRNRLHVFFREERGDGIHHVHSLDGTTWSAPTFIGARTRSHLSVAALGDSLMLAYVNFEGDGIMYSQLQGDKLDKWSHANTGHTTSASRPGIVAFNGRYHLFYRDGNGNGVMHIWYAGSDGWKGANPFHVLNTQTSSSPVATAYDGKLHLFYRDDSGNAIYHAFSGDGEKFEYATPFNIGLNIDDGPSAAILGDALCLAGVDANKKGIMRAVHFPPIKSPLKGWDYIAALDLGAAQVQPGPANSLELKLAGALQDRFHAVHLESGAFVSPAAASNAPLCVSFRVKAKTKSEQPPQAQTDARLIVAAALKIVPAAHRKARWDLVLDFDKPLVQPRLEGLHGDAATIAALRDALVSQIAMQPPLRVGSIDAPFGEKTPIPDYMETVQVADPLRPARIWLALLSTTGKAPDEPDCRSFAPSVLPVGSDAALYAANAHVIRLVGGIVQALLREKMGPQGKDGTRDLTYTYKPTPDEPKRSRAYTDGNYCRFWNREYQPSVDWSSADAAYSRLTIDLRLDADPGMGIDVYVEAQPSLSVQLGSDRSKIVFQLEMPIPRSHEEHGTFGKCAEGEAAKGALDLANELGQTLSKINPVDLGSIGEFTQVSINQLGELFVAAKRK